MKWCVLYDSNDLMRFVLLNPRSIDWSMFTRCFEFVKVTRSTQACWKQYKEQRNLTIGRKAVRLRIRSLAPQARWAVTTSSLALRTTFIIWHPHHLVWQSTGSYWPPKLEVPILFKNLKHYKILNTYALCNLFLIWKLVPGRVYNILIEV